jgi:hypothetical protein
MLPACLKIVRLRHAARIAYIISPTQLDDGSVIDHATTVVHGSAGRTH